MIATPMCLFFKQLPEKGEYIPAQFGGHRQSISLSGLKWTPIIQSDSSILYESIGELDLEVDAPIWPVVEQLEVLRPIQRNSAIVRFVATNHSQSPLTLSGVLLKAIEWDLYSRCFITMTVSQPVRFKVVRESDARSAATGWTVVDTDTVRLGGEIVRRTCESTTFELEIPVNVAVAGGATSRLSFEITTQDDDDLAFLRFPFLSVTPRATLAVFPSSLRLSDARWN